MTNNEIDKLHRELDAKAKPVTVVEHKKPGRRHGRASARPALKGYRQKKARSFKVNVVVKKKFHVGGRDLSDKKEENVVMVAPAWMIRKELIGTARRDKRNAGDKRYERLKKQEAA